MSSISTLDLLKVLSFLPLNCAAPEKASPREDFKRAELDVYKEVVGAARRYQEVIGNRLAAVSHDARRLQFLQRSSPRYLPGDSRNKERSSPYSAFEREYMSLREKELEIKEEKSSLTKKKEFVERYLVELSSQKVTPMKLGQLLNRRVQRNNYFVAGNEFNK